MRSVTFVVSQSDGWFQSYGQAFADAEGVAPVAIHSLRLLADETALVLYELSGDPDRIRDILAATPDAIDAVVTESAESVFAQILFEPTDTVRRFLELPHEHPVTIETPIAFTGDGGIRVTGVGPVDVLGDVFDGFGEEVQLAVEEVGEYHPASERPFARLSERQQEVLRVAVEMGYFEEPRQTTQADLAAALDCTAATVGSHLRRIQRALLPAMVPDAERPDAL